MKKVAARIGFIRDRFGFTFPEAEIQVLLALDNPGKPHIGKLMIACVGIRGILKTLETHEKETRKNGRLLREPG